MKPTEISLIIENIKSDEENLIELEKEYRLRKNNIIRRINNNKLKLKK